MHDKHKLLYRMRNPPRQPWEESLLSRLTETKDPSDHQLTNQSNQTDSQDSLQGLRLNLTQGSTKMYSSTATPSSNHTVRGRSRNRPYMFKSSLNLRMHSATTETGRMQHLGRSSRQWKATTPRWMQQQPRGERSTRCSAPPALLYRIQMDHSPMRNQVPSDSKWMNQHTHGLPEDSTNVPSCGTLLPKPSDSSRSTLSTQRQPNDHSSTNLIARNSQTQSGRTSSPDEQSTSTLCSADNSPQHTTIPKSRNLGTSKSPLELLSQQRLSRTEATGQSHGTEPSEQRRSLSPTGFRNSPAMGSTWSIYSPSHTRVCTAESLPLTKPSERESEASGTSSYQTLRSLPTSKSRTWIRSGYLSSLDHQRRTVSERERKGRGRRKMNPVTTGTTEDVGKKKRTAADYTSATSAERRDIKERSVESDPTMKR